MKRSIIIILIILALVISGGFLQTQKIKSINKSSVKELESISLSLEKQNYNEAKDRYRDYESHWEKNRKLLSFIISHDDLDFITHHTSRLGVYLSERGELDAYAEISELTDVYNELDEKFKLGLRNIL